MIIWSGNFGIDSNVIQTVASQLKQHPQSLVKENYYTSYYIKDSEKPDRVFDETYTSILNNVCADFSLYGRVNYTFEYWTQIYPSNSTSSHLVHDHFCGYEIFSWVHFIQPTKDCFYFIDSNNNKTYPKQDSGDFIVFPPWTLHGVSKNDTNKERIAIAGNVALTTIQNPVTGNKLVSHKINNKLCLWEIQSSN